VSPFAPFIDLARRLISDKLNRIGVLDDTTLWSTYSSYNGVDNGKPNIRVTEMAEQYAEGGVVTIVGEIQTTRLLIQQSLALLYNLEEKRSHVAGIVTPSQMEIESHDIHRLYVPVSVNCMISENYASLYRFLALKLRKVLLAKSAEAQISKDKIPEAAAQDDAPEEKETKQANTRSRAEQPAALQKKKKKKKLAQLGVLDGMAAHLRITLASGVEDEPKLEKAEDGEDEVMDNAQLDIVPEGSLSVESGSATTTLTDPRLYAQRQEAASALEALRQLLGFACELKIPAQAGPNANYQQNLHVVIIVENFHLPTRDMNGQKFLYSLVELCSIHPRLISIVYSTPVVNIFECLEKRVVSRIPKTGRIYLPATLFANSKTSGQSSSSAAMSDDAMDTSNEGCEELIGFLKSFIVPSLLLPSNFLEWKRQCELFRVTLSQCFQTLNSQLYSEFAQQFNASVVCMTGNSHGTWN